MSQVTEKHHLSKLKAVIETYSYVKPSWIYIQASGLESLYVFGRAETFTFITAHFLRASNYEIMVNAVLKRRASDCLLWAPRCCAPMKSRSVERCAPCVRVFMEIFVADVKPRLWPLLLKEAKAGLFTTARQCWWQAGLADLWPRVVLTAAVFMSSRANMRLVSQMVFETDAGFLDW